MVYQIGIYTFNVIYNFTLSKVFPVSLNKTQLVVWEFDFENCWIEESSYRLSSNQTKFCLVKPFQGTVDDLNICGNMTQQNSKFYGRIWAFSYKLQRDLMCLFIFMYLYNQYH